MVPHVFLIDKSGKVVNNKAEPGAALKEEMERIMK
jgi:hypothetical protein